MRAQYASARPGAAEAGRGRASARRRSRSSGDLHHVGRAWHESQRRREDVPSRRCDPGRQRQPREHVARRPHRGRSVFTVPTEACPNSTARKLSSSNSTTMQLAVAGEAQVDDRREPSRHDAALGARAALGVPRTGLDAPDARAVLRSRGSPSAHRRSRPRRDRRRRSSRRPRAGISARQLADERELGTRRPDSRRAASRSGWAPAASGSVATQSM